MTQNEEARLATAERGIELLIENHRLLTLYTLKMDERLEEHREQHKDYQRDVQQLMNVILRMAQKQGWLDDEDTLGAQ